MTKRRDFLKMLGIGAAGSTVLPKITWTESDLDFTEPPPPPLKSTVDLWEPSENVSDFNIVVNTSQKHISIIPAIKVTKQGKFNQTRNKVLEMRSYHSYMMKYFDDYDNMYLDISHHAIHPTLICMENEWTVDSHYLYGTVITDDFHGKYNTTIKISGDVDYSRVKNISLTTNGGKAIPFNMGGIIHAEGLQRERDEWLILTFDKWTFDGWKKGTTKVRLNPHAGIIHMFMDDSLTDVFHS